MKIMEMPILDDSFECGLSSNGSISIVISTDRICAL